MADEAGDDGTRRRHRRPKADGIDQGRRANRMEKAALVAVTVLAANAAVQVATIAGDLAGHQDRLDRIIAALGILAVPLILYIAWHWRRLRWTIIDQEEELGRRRAAEQEEQATRQWVRARVEEVLSGGSELVMHFQPIVDLNSNAVAGHEALARFTIGTPEQWFGSAAEAGLGVELEITAVNAALSALDVLDGYLSINASPATLLSEQFWLLLKGTPSTRVVIELTEHVRVEEYDRFEQALARLRQLGIRLAIDDAGAGHSSMRHIIHMAPEIIKLDRSITNKIDVDPARRSMVSAMVTFGGAVNAIVIAEGVERAEEAEVMREMGVGFGQGWYFGRPVDLARAARGRTEGESPVL